MTKDFSSAIDNIFMDYRRINSFQVFFWLMGSLIMKLNIFVAWGIEFIVLISYYNYILLWHL